MLTPNATWKTTPQSVIDWFELRGFEFCNDTSGEYFICRLKDDTALVIARSDWEEQGPQDLTGDWSVLDDETGELFKGTVSCATAFARIHQRQLDARNQ